MQVNLSLATFPGIRHEDAARLAIEFPHEEALLGTLCVDHVQIVPQSRGQITPDTARELASKYPNTQFRLHANSHVMQRRVFADLSSWNLHVDFFRAAAAISSALDAPAYSAHAGSRAQATCEEVLDAARRATDLFGCPVAVEGHYPTPRQGDKWLFSSWGEYRLLFDSGVPYALDLSHLNIVAHHSGTTEPQLVSEMLACERCIEVHLSDNDGGSDQHQVLSSALPWWWPLTEYIHPNAIVFTEGNRLAR